MRHTDIKARNFLEKTFYNAANNYRYKWGIDLFEKSFRKYPELKRNERVLTHLGLLYDHFALSQNRKRKNAFENKAIASYEAALKINPHSPAATWGIGRVWWHRKNKKAIPYALRAYRLAKANKIQSGLFAQNIGSVYKAIGNYKKGEYWLLKEQRENPDDWGSYINLVLFYKNIKKNKEKTRLYVTKLEKLFRKTPPSFKKTAWGKTILKEIIIGTKSWIKS